ncbi:MAG: WhiB family transcriptional regulator, redox-sensing transcriptional regulator [Mycobacterium sp.]|jgi:WhiB family redox-sensing transcriptional regulator|nr:WhiB family transcriptional regulator, redox-sensing transcriptional regulator [Mycobacterium sp.]
MSFEHSDFDRVAPFDSRLFGSAGNTRHTINGPAPIETSRRPQLSLVPDPIDVAPARPAITPEDDLWQEKALCAQTDPEAFFPEKGGSTREAKRICLGCEVRDACLDYALAHDERFGIWGGLSERERRRLKRGII